jgi:phage FluMu protein Com
MAELFKFRCYQCQKLIGAPPSRFGSVVKCPRCAVELIVPSPDDESPPDDEPDSDAFRPESLGIQIEPEPISRPTVKPPAAPEPVGPDPVAFLEKLDEAPEGQVPGESTEARDESDAGPVETPDLPETGDEPLVPRKRGRAALAAGPTPRARDVVLPRTAAVAWALFALLALAFAFTTGLFVGQRLGK